MMKTGWNQLKEVVCSDPKMNRLTHTVGRFSSAQSGPFYQCSTEHYVGQSNIWYWDHKTQKWVFALLSGGVGVWWGARVAPSAGGRPRPRPSPSSPCRAPAPAPPSSWPAPPSWWRPPSRAWRPPAPATLVSSSWRTSSSPVRRPPSSTTPAPAPSPGRRPPPGSSRHQHWRRWYLLSVNLATIHVLHCVECVGVCLVLNVGKALVQPRTLALATKLNLFDLSKGGENLLQVILVHIPGQPPNVDLRRLRRWASLPPPTPAPLPLPRLGPRSAPAIARLGPAATIAGLGPRFWAGRALLGGWRPLLGRRRRIFLARRGRLTRRSLSTLLLLICLASASSTRLRLGVLWVFLGLLWLLLWVSLPTRVRGAGARVGTWVAAGAWARAARFPLLLVLLSCFVPPPPLLFISAAVRAACPWFLALLLLLLALIVTCSSRRHALQVVHLPGRWHFHPLPISALL